MDIRHTDVALRAELDDEQRDLLAALQHYFMRRSEWAMRRDGLAVLATNGDYAHSERPSGTAPDPSVTLGL